MIRVPPLKDISYVDCVTIIRIMSNFYACHDYKHYVHYVTTVQFVHYSAMCVCESAMLVCVSST